MIQRCHEDPDKASPRKLVDGELSIGDLCSLANLSFYALVLIYAHEMAVLPVRLPFPPLTPGCSGL